MALATSADMPHAAPPEHRTRLLLATDLGPASAAAAERAIDLARRLDGELLIVSVIDGRSLPMSGRTARRLDQVRDERIDAAQALVLRGRAAGVPVTFLVWEGDPGHAIVDAARAEAVDLVLVGTHGRRAIGRALLGSVSDHVVRNAPCPVVVVRPTGEPAPPT